MNTLILDTIARHLDALPLGQSHRAEIYAAWEGAPDAEIDFNQADAYDGYILSDAGRAWRRVRDFKMRHPEGTGTYATTLDEMSFHALAPTKTEILEALARADHQLNGAHA